MIDGAKPRKCVFLHCPELDEGGYPEVSPFSTKRAGMARKTAMSMGLLSGADVLEDEPVRLTRDELETFHASRYLDAVKAAEDGELTPEAFLMGLGTPDCPVFKGMYDYVSLAAGGTLTGARLILSGEARITFNPSGGFHHAGPDKASGFCYMNDVVIAIMELAAAGKRVLFLDIDAHHGDGVQDAFYERNDVMTVSLHESGKTLFPGTGSEGDIGAGPGKGFTVNVPLPAGTRDDLYRDAFEKTALPLMGAYEPDIVVVEIGMDGLSGDPLAHLQLTNNVHADILESLLAFGRPILATGGGGYDVDNTVRGWALAWSVLSGGEDHGAIGMGGVMLENTDWFGGLRDRTLSQDYPGREAAEAEVAQVVERLKATVFAVHGL